MAQLAKLLPVVTSPYARQQLGGELPHGSALSGTRAALEKRPTRQDILLGVLLELRGWACPCACTLVGPVSDFLTRAGGGRSHVGSIPTQDQNHQLPVAPCSMLPGAPLLLSTQLSHSSVWLSCLLNIQNLHVPVKR